MVETTDIKSLAKFDVIKFAKDIISEVESIRSFKNATDAETKERFQVPDESRVNAFFRLVGFPMFIVIKKKDPQNKQTSTKVAEGPQHLTPGYCANRFEGYIIENVERVGNTEISNVLNFREDTLKSEENQIGSELKNEDMTSALQSPIALLPNLSKKGPDSFEIVGKDKHLRLAFKSLLPTITSYQRILPRKNEIARPFLRDIKDQQPNSETTLKKPFLETVARIRLVAIANASNTKDQQKSQEIVDSIRTTVGEDTFDKELNKKQDVALAGLKSASVLERFIIRKLISSLVQLASKWYELKKKQEIYFKKTNFDVSIKTSSAKRSIFGKRADVSSDLTFSANSTQGINLKKWKTMLAKEEAMQTLLPSDDAIFGTDLSKSVTKNTALAALVNPFMSLISYNLDQLKKSIKTLEEGIKSDIQTVEKLRVELEMMTGEFTGLSVPDVVAVVTALFIIDIKYLIALFDKESIDNMKKDTSLKSALDLVGDVSGIDKAIEAVEQVGKIIEWLFVLLNSLNKSTEDRTLRTRQKSNRQKASTEKVRSVSQSTENE